MSTPLSGFNASSQLQSQQPQTQNNENHHPMDHQGIISSMTVFQRALDSRNQPSQQTTGQGGNTFQQQPSQAQNVPNLRQVLQPLSSNTSNFQQNFQIVQFDPNNVNSNTKNRRNTKERIPHCSNFMLNRPQSNNAQQPNQNSSKDKMSFNFLLN